MESIKNISEIIKLSNDYQQIAWRLINESGIISLWQNIGAEVNIVGSLNTGLLIHKDIDLHIYTEKLSIVDSFSVVAKLAEKLSLIDVQYKNLINTEEECIEWHALFNDMYGNLWKLDMIHIRKGSKYDGTVEKVTEAIKSNLTPEIREIILKIKYDMPSDMIIPGIEVYHAVFTGKVTSYEELLEWKKNNPLINSLEWLPSSNEE